MSDDVLARLSAAIETESIGQDDESTKDMIQRISAHLNEMSEAPGSDEDASYYSDDDYDDGPQLEMPAFPTPYEIWAAKHEVVEEEREQPQLDPEQWNALADRLSTTNRKAKADILQRQQQELAEELSGLTFQPYINKKSRELAGNTQSLQDRQMSMLENKQQQLEAERKRKEAAELAQVTAQPNLSTPCVCGQGKGLTDSTEADLGAHTTFCLNFMRSCASKGRTKKSQKLNSVARNTEDMLRYGEDKRLRREQRRQILSEQEERELTFAPQLNQNSLRLSEKMKKEGRSRRAGREITGTHADAGHEEETFQPQTNDRSRAILERSEKYQSAKASERLYAQAVEQNQNHNKRQAALAEEHHVNVATPLAFVRGSLAEVQLSDALRAVLQQPAANLMINSNMSVVEYQQPYSFVLECFNAR